MYNLLYCIAFIKMFKELCRLDQIDQLIVEEKYFGTFSVSIYLCNKNTGNFKRFYFFLNPH